jgi:localization factor PodJL
MKFAVPWKVKGIDADARETAREAARRAGMSVGEWLNTVIIDSAVEEGVRPRGRYAEPEDSYADDENLAGVHDRLDDLTRQLERLAHAGINQANGKAAKSQSRGSGGGGTPPAANPELAEAIARLDRRLDQLIVEGRSLYDHTDRRLEQLINQRRTVAATVEHRRAAASGGGLPEIDQAIAEIMARQQALEADPTARPPEKPAAQQAEPVAPPPAAFAAPIPVPTQNLSGLEQQLRHITTQIEALRQPRLEEGIAALRGELGEILRAMTEAMPRRAIEALETEVRALAGRFDSSANFGVDPSTLASVENGLTQVRDALRGLTPAENLIGFHEAVRDLSQKIDLLATTSQDPAAFQQLEAAIATLRGILSHVATNEALTQLAGEVRGLATKVDEVTSASGGNALAVLEKRITHIADALDARAQNGGVVPPQLEAVIKGLSDKIERIQLTSGDQMALGHLEDRIVKLVEKLDASGARFTQLEAIERGLADLLVHLETPAGGGAAAPRAARAPVQVDGLQRDVARTQNSLEAVHGTLGHVVDRLAMIETDIRGEPKAGPAIPKAASLPLSATRLPPPPAATPEPPPSRATAAAQAAAAMARANPPAARRPIDPNLPPDHPLEPGSNVSRGRSSPSERIAASEAALGPAKPPVISDPGGKSNFITAARRAAQAATADPSPRDLRAVADQDRGEETIGKKLVHRVRSLFVGVSVILVVGAALRVAANLTDLGDSPATPAPTQAETKSLALNSKPAVSAPAAQTAPAAVPKLAPATTTASSDVTGSVQSQAPSWMPQSPLAPTPGPTLAPARPAGGDKLPAAIGGAPLRMAAAAGTAAAEYEVGVRYAEGHGVPVNFSEAARWLEFAAKQGVTPAQFRLGSLYEKGTGVKKDVAAAIRLYTAAAEKGHAKAMHNLAVLYAEGAAGKPDYRMAAQWFRKASDHGVSDSQYNLAILYARGIGMEQNLAESYKWFAIAAAFGDQEAVKKRDEIGARLDPASLTAARLAAQAWTALPPREEATSVAPPPGGWDAETPAAPTPSAPKSKARASGPIKIGGL